MSYISLSHSHVKRARKEHYDDAFGVLFDVFSYDELERELSGKDLEEYLRRKACGFKIQIGEPYIRMNGIFEGDFCSIAYSHFGNALCIRFDMFED